MIQKLVIRALILLTSQAILNLSCMRLKWIVSGGF